MIILKAKVFGKMNDGVGLVFLMLLQTVLSIDCPSLCECTSSSYRGGSLNINCDNRGLITFPNISHNVDHSFVKLSVRNNSFENLTLSRNHFKYSNIYSLDLSNNMFLKVEHDAFRYLMDSLTSLAMNNVHGGIDNLAAVKSLHKLREFSFRNNVLDTADLPGGKFSGTKIAQLDLSENNFGYIDKNAFSNINETLMVLYINNAGVTLSDIEFLRDVPNLVELSLDGCDNTQLMPRIFKNLGLKKLRSLSIKNGKILVIRSNAFEGVENLEEIDLTNNKLRLVPSDALMSLEHLKSLNLSFNRDIASIVTGAFSGMDRLEVLDLRGTGINLIQAGGLAPSLKTLILQNCNLPGDSYFLVEALKKLPNLEILDISYNDRLHRIYNSTFDYLSKLNVLDLSGNMMLKISDTLVKGLEDNLKILKLNNMGLNSLPVDIISSLAALERLEFEGNNLTNVSSVFRGSPEETMLSEINFKNNNISVINKNAFTVLKDNFTLELDGNNLRNLKFTESLNTCFFKKLTVTMNPVICYCGIKNVVKTVCGELKGTCALENNTLQDLNTYVNVDCDVASHATSYARRVFSTYLFHLFIILILTIIS